MSNQNTKEIVIKKLEGHTGMFKSTNMEYSDFKRAQSLGQNQPTFSKRFNDKLNIDDETTFHFVNPTSTVGEKILQTRAALLSNEKGIKIHGLELAKPNAHFVRKLEIADKILENQASVERLKSKENTFTSPLTSNIKFEQRY